MEKVIYNLIFNRKKQLNPEGKALIQVEAYWKKQKKYFSTKVYIKPCQWDKKRRSVRNHPNMDALNQYLQDFILELEKKELSITQSGRSFSLDGLKEEFVERPQSFTQFMLKEIKNSNLKVSTMKNHGSTLHLLEQFKPNVDFSDFNFNFLCDFENYLLKNEYHRNTIAKHMKHLKRCINLAINKDLFEMHKYPFRKYKIRYMETKRTHLTPEELHQLESLRLDRRPSLRKCLDMFLFSCYTGLRFSDVVRIKKDNFLYIDDKLWLVYSSVKTDVNVRLPLSLLFEGKSIPIYERYKHNPRTLFNSSPDSNSNINKQLVRIADMAKLEKRISFHTARHTNATLLLYNGANITTVQKLLGHKSVRTTEIYSNIMDMTIIRDLEKINTF
ncbi:MAG: site-specific integrase [Tannerellaceae bacterium]|nr:site-specific integrase [Tannerellaceae bacterium]